MKKLIVGATLAVASLSFSAAPALADPPHGAGDPGFPNNCTGLETRYVAEGNDISPFNSANGIGNVANANDATAKAVMDYIKVVVCGG